MPKRTAKAPKKRGGTPPVKAAALGVGLSMALIAALAAVFALLIAKETVPEEASGVIAAFAVFLACLLGPRPLLRAAGRRALPMSYLHMGLLMAALAIVKLIGWPGAPYGNWPVLAAAPAGATLCGLIHAKRAWRGR